MMDGQIGGENVRGRKESPDGGSGGVDWRGEDG